MKVTVNQLKEMLEKCQRQRAILANKCNILNQQNRLLRQQLMTAKKTMVPLGDNK